MLTGAGVQKDPIGHSVGWVGTGVMGNAQEKAIVIGQGRGWWQLTGQKA